MQNRDLFFNYKQFIDEYRTPSQARIIFLFLPNEIDENKYFWFG